MTARWVIRWTKMADGTLAIKARLVLAVFGTCSKTYVKLMAQRHHGRDRDW